MQTWIHEIFRKSALVARIVIFSFAARLRSLLVAFSYLTIKQTLFSHCVWRNNHSFAPKFQPGTDPTTTQPSLHLHIHVMCVSVPEPFGNQSLNQWIKHFFFTFSLLIENHRISTFTPRLIVVILILNAYKQVYKSNMKLKITIIQSIINFCFYKQVVYNYFKLYAYNTT